MDLKETVAAAKAEGRSYGEYAAQAAPPVEVNVPPGLMSQKEKAAKEAEPVPPEPEKAKPVPPQPERRRITFGEILDLLSRNSTEVELRMGGDNITGAANSRLWRPLECMTVANIDADESSLTVWLEEES